MSRAGFKDVVIEKVALRRERSEEVSAFVVIGRAD